MAVPARSESPLATRSPRAVAANDGYGSLMGMGAPRKKKKPVLVLDADELAKAHLEMAAGGAQIMEEAADHMGEERVRRPASLLGLAPMGAEDIGTEDASAYPAIPDASTWEDEDVALPPIPEDYTDEGELDEEEDTPDQSFNLEHLLRPAAKPAAEEEVRESVIPSIEEQLKRMRALPKARPEAAEDDASEAAATRRPGPMERLDEMGFGADGFGLARAAPEPAEPVADEPVAAEPVADETAWPDVEEAEEEVFELGPDLAEEPVEDPVAGELEAAAEPVEDEAPLELELLAEEPEEAEALPETVEQQADSDDFDDFDDAPDFSWMEPEQRRELHIAQGEHSSLRARLVHAEEQLQEEAPRLSPLQRIAHWFARLRG